MSLQTFSKQVGIRPIGVGKIGSSLIDSFSKGETQKITQQQTIVKKEPKKLSKWQWISKQLMKPVGTVAAEVENIGRLISGQKAQVPLKAGLSVLAGKREYSFSTLWRDYGKKVGISENVSGKIGLLFDIVDDPFIFLTGGLTKLGTLATKVSSLQKAGKTIKEGSKLAQQITKSGYKVEELVLAGTKAKQVSAGQRAFLQIAGKPIVKGERIYKATEKLAEMMKVSKLGVGIRRTFTTRSGIKEVDNLIDNFKNLSETRKELVLDNAIKIQKQVDKMKPDDIKLLVEAIENPIAKTLVKSKKIIGLADEMEDLFKQMKTTEKGKGILKTELEQYFPHIKAQTKFGERIKAFFQPKKYSAMLSAAKGRKIEGTLTEINARFGKEFFQSNPVVAYAQRGMASAKAISAKDFLDDIGKKFFVNAEDAPIRFQASTNPLLKGLKAKPEVVRVVDQYIQSIKPDDLKLIVRGYDKVLNWWKAQVLISPSYHIRNMFSNFWNNWLAGVKNPVLYEKARKVQSGKALNKIIMTTDAGETLTRGQLLKEVKEHRVLGRGFYGADIKEAMADKIGAISQRAKKIGGWMPWKQDNVLFKTNRAVGSAIENNARVAHYLHKRQIGMSVDDAARSVKKFLFDYEDLSPTEQSIFKRILPFYTWTRKNIPLQLENFITQPEKYAAVAKIQKEIEAGTPNPKTEKYMSSYITENIPVKIRTNKEGNVEYFLLGWWLPSASAIDFLSQPIENLIQMTTPLLKTPIELWANKSMFFKNTLGEASKIEYYYKQPTEFVGITMRKKAATLMRNIRILNDLHKLMKTPAKDEPENSWTVKLLSVLFGKAATYDIEKAQYFYRRDTEERISEYKAAIKKAKRLGRKEHAQKLLEELRTFKKTRGH